MLAGTARGALRYVAEALIVLPVLAVVLFWGGLIMAGISHIYDLQLHGAQISQILLVMVALSFPCLVAGVLLLAIAVRGQRG